MRKPIVALAVMAALLAIPGTAVSSGAGTHAASAGSADPDRDRVDTHNERRQGTDPHMRDSDRDGRPDGREDADRDGLSNAAEDASGNDPVDRDSDGDGTPDGREGAGVVTAFADGAMTVRLATGGSVSATVDELTTVSCPTEAAYERAQTGRAKGLRRSGKRPRKGRRAGGSALRLATGAAGAASSEAPFSTAQDPDEDLGDDEIGDDPDWTDEEGDEDWSGEDDWDGETGDMYDDDPGADDEDWSGAVEGPCLPHLRRGTRVHASLTDSDAESSWFVEVELVR